jgi:hypothetical protein
MNRPFALVLAIWALAAILVSLAGCGLIKKDPEQRRRDFERSCINSEGPHMADQCRAAARNIRFEK